MAMGLKVLSWCLMSMYLRDIVLLCHGGNSEKFQNEGCRVIYSL